MACFTPASGHSPPKLCAGWDWGAVSHANLWYLEQMSHNRMFRSYQTLASLRLTSANFKATSYLCALSSYHRSLEPVPKQSSSCCICGLNITCIRSVCSCMLPAWISIQPPLHCISWEGSHKSLSSSQSSLNESLVHLIALSTLRMLMSWDMGLGFADCYLE